MARQAPTTRRKNTTTTATAAQTSAAQSTADTTSAKPTGISAADFRNRVSQAAYYRAERRGFAPGYEERDWLEAEAEVMQRLGLRSPPG